MTRTSELLWKGLIEHYEDADLYDYEYRRRRRDVLFYKAFADRASEGPVLELAGGSGRITRGLVSAGRTVLSLDLSQSMLNRAQSRIQRMGRAARQRALFVRGDMKQFSFGQRFPLIVMGFNSFEHLYTRVEVEACLSCVRDHLTPDGLFVFDCQNPDLRWLSRDPDKRWARTKFKHPVSGQRYVYSTNHTYDPISQIVLIRLYYQPIEDGPEKVVMLSQRKFFPAELEALLAMGGFAVEERLSDFEDKPLTGDAESQVVVCRVAKCSN